jgi:hypothetical protein
MTFANGWLRVGRRPDGSDVATRISVTHTGMMQRCFYPKQQNYPRYGGRGITVCESWRTFATFRKWAITSGYRKGLSIERIDNDGNYEPSNCRWATASEQARNRSTTPLLTHNGKTLSLAEWAEITGINPSTIRTRIYMRGWTVARAFETPPYPRSAWVSLPTMKDMSNPSGLCQCGCGKPTSIATRTVSKCGHIKGKPIRFICGHVNRKGFT